jgi:C-terminal processing protease CtpA/Prc
MHTNTRTLGAVLIAGALAAGSLGPRRHDTAQQRTIGNLHAFSRLYGFVRFFHPSDEAAATDWARFAIYGAGRVKGAESTDALRTQLIALFRPIAPTITVYADGAEPPPPTHVPTDTAGLELVAWQHEGVLINPARANAYWSLRTHRSVTMAAPGYGYATLAQAIDAQPYRGKRIRLRAQVRAYVRGSGNRGQIWLRVDREGNEAGFFDNMQDRPITSAEWHEYEITGEVAEDADRITFGALVNGAGTFEFDGFHLAVADGAGEWTPVALANPGFEAGDTTLHRQDAGTPVRPATTNRWVAISPGYTYTIADRDAPEGRRAATIRQLMQSRTMPLFPQTPAPGETVDESLGAGLRVRFPISLYSDASGTLPHADPAALRALRANLAKIDLAAASADDDDVRLADAVIAWNVFEHFYPYFDVVPVDWMAELDQVLGETLNDRTGEAFYHTLQRLVVQLHDGHGRVANPRYTRTGGLPWRVEWIEDRVVVTASTDSAVRHGDVVVALDGTPAADAVAAEEALISGSPQWKRSRAMQALGTGARGTTVRVRLDRDGREVEATLTRGPRRVIPEFDRPMIAKLDEGIWYVDLDRAPTAAIDSVIDSLAAARGVIFDLRGYPAGSPLVLQHLLTGPDTSSAWMRVPRALYPDRKRSVGYQPGGWHLQPRQPHIGGRVAFITDGRAISYAESVMGYVEGYRLGAIIGQPTAGTNGNVNPFTLPGGFRVVWTGMQVLKHDGSQHHLIGVQPTVPAVRTLKGVRAGRDELLEVALEVVKGQR